MIKKIERFNFTALLDAAKQNDYEKVGLLRMHIKQHELTESEIRQIIDLSTEEERKVGGSCISSLLVLRALLHEKGIGGTVNFPAAIELYERAIQLNNPAAMCFLTLLPEAKLSADKIEQHNQNAEKLKYSWAFLLRGFSMQDNNDFHKAAEYYLAATKLNNPHAINTLGCFYVHGLDKVIDYFKGFNFLNQATELGCYDAMYNLACLYLAGKGCELNYAQACYLFRYAYYLYPEEKILKGLEFCYRQLQLDLIGLYYVLMGLDLHESQEKKLQRLFSADPALFIVLLLNDELLTELHKYNYLKLLMDYCTVKNSQLAILIEEDKTNPYHAEASQLLGAFCTQYAFQLPQDEELINARLDLVELVPTSSTYYSEALVIKADSLCYLQELTQPWFLLALIYYEVDSVYLLLLQCDIVTVI